MKKFIEKLNKIRKYPLVVMFFTLIFFVTIVDLITPDKTFSDLENKYLQKLPKFEYDKFMNNEFVPKFETYINEQFMMRNKWIDLKSRAEYYLGKTENNGIVYGKDGYLLDKVETIDQKQLDRNIENVRKFIEKYKDKNVTIGLIPNSFEVLKDKLPLGLKLYDQASLIDNVYKDYSQYSNVSTLDLLGLMNEHKSEYIYYRTDHHWTTLGAYYAYDKYMQSVGKDSVDLDKLKKNEIDFFLGTYYSKAKNFNAKYDMMNYYNVNIESMKIGDKTYNDIYDYDKFEKRDKYAAFLYGNNDLTIITSKEAESKPESERTKILLVKDSFGNSFAPYLTYSYDEVYILDLRSNTKKVSEIMSEYDFDDILILYSVNNFISDVNIVRAIY